jgi:hypothetical protein
MLALAVTRLRESRQCKAMGADLCQEEGSGDGRPFRYRPGAGVGHPCQLRRIMPAATV